jgi:antitoxin YefM
MTTLTVSNARTTLYQLVAMLQDGEAPVLITGKKGNAVLVSEDEWRSIVETLHLSSIPGMSLSIQQGMKEPLDECSSDIDL